MHATVAYFADNTRSSSVSLGLNTLGKHILTLANRTDITYFQPIIRQHFWPRCYKEPKWAENCNKWHDKIFILNCNQHFGNFKSRQFPTSECCLTKLLPCVLFERYINILALEMASPGNRHCANCIGTLSFLRQMQIGGDSAANASTSAAA